jgi:hypothetical protein
MERRDVWGVKMEVRFLLSRPWFCGVVGGHACLKNRRLHFDMGGTTRTCAAPALRQLVERPGDNRWRRVRIPLVGQRYVRHAR